MLIKKKYINFYDKKKNFFFFRKFTPIAKLIRLKNEYEWNYFILK